jgi:EAL domain-containing protein (putative c-di-GMP-specific phosphodiesterase class I)
VQKDFTQQIPGAWMGQRFQKKQGIIMKPKNFFASPQSAPDSADKDQRSFLSNLSNAINHDELCLHYQPRYKLLTGKAEILEAMVRWQRPGVGLLYPETFIPAAEAHGLIYQLDIWVFEQCCKDLTWLREHLDSSVRLAVNISVLSSESMYFSQKLIELCDQYQLSLSDFLIEITVSTHSHDIRKAKAFCTTLTDLGAEICLDDFGSGQSPLINLFELPVSSIIIDRTLVHNLIQSPRSEIIIKHLISLASDLGIKTIAECIEHVDEYKLLRELGCDQIQGHFMCHPMRGDKLTIADLST